jgi:hypothetical protein
VTGSYGDWKSFPGSTTLDAVDIGLVMLACMAAVAGLISVLRPVEEKAS